MSNSAFILSLGTLSGDVSTPPGSGVTTLATVNSNVGTYGNSTNIPIITVNAKGLITAIANTSISVGTGSVTNIVTGTGLTGGTITNTGTISLGTSGATAGTYGSTSAIPVVTVDALGRVTSITTASVSVPSGTINLTGDVTGTGQTGTALSTVLANSGVAAGTYGNNATTNTITVDSKGRITNISTNSISTAIVPFIAGAGTANNELGGATALAIGSNSAANSASSIAIGRAAFASGVNSITIGDQPVTTTENSIVIGEGTATQVGQVIIGFGTSRIYVNGTTGALTANNLSGTNTGDQDLSALMPRTGGTFTGDIAATNLSGTNTGDQTITLTGDATGSGTGSFAITLGSVVTAGTYNQVIVGTKGLVIAGTNIAFGSIATQSASNVNITGGTITGLSNPVVVSDAATKGYVDGLVQGLNAKLSVRVATVSSGTLSSAFANGQTVDGIVLATGDRILVKNQTNSSQNGIYTVNASGAPTRTFDGDTWAELVSAFVFVEEGSTNADTGWTCIVNQGGTLGTTDVVWAQFSGAGSYSADGSGIIQTGSVFSLQLDGTTLSKSASGLQVSTGGISNNEVATNAAIALTKLASVGTNNVVLVSNASGIVSPSAISTTTLSYLDATSSIQTQLNARLTANQNITVTGDATGTGSTAIALTLANSGVTAGTGYNTFTVDSKGRITSASTVASGTGSVTSIIAGTDLTGGTITNTGILNLTTSGVTAGTGYNTFTVNAKGIVTAASTTTYGTGSVVSVAVTGANGISVSGSPISNSGTIGLSLGTITPASVVATGNITGANLSGTNTGDQTITLTGDITGSGTGSFVTTLGSVTTAGTYNQVVVGTKGLVTSGTTVGYLTANQNITVTGDVTGSGSTAIALTLGTSGATAGTYGNTTNIPTVVVNAKGIVTAISNNTVTIGTGTVTNIVTGTGLTGGTITNTGTIALATSGVTAGTYNQVTVDTLGRVTAGTTIAGASTASNARTVTQTAHGFVVNNLLRLNGTVYTLALADSDINAEVVGIVTSVVDANTFVLTTDGYVTGLSGLTAGSAYFLSPTTAGLLTVTLPTTVGQIVKPVLIADTATTGYFNNWRGQVVANVDVVSGLRGTTTNDNAAAGFIGEYISSSLLFGGALALTSGTSRTITSINLTPGDWEVEGVVAIANPGPTSISQKGACISNTNNTLTSVGQLGNIIIASASTVSGGFSEAIPSGRTRVSIASTTTYYLIASFTFTAGTLSAYGQIAARRTR